MARPDIAIGDHPDLGTVANPTTGVPAAKVLLGRLGFVRDKDTGLYVLLADEPGQPDTRTARARHAVTVLRGAAFHVDTDIAYEPESAPAQQPGRVEPDVAFGRHPEHGITAAITGERPYAAMVLRAAGFTRDRERDVYTLPDGLSHRAASTVARNTALVLRQSGSTVRILPGTLAAPVASGRRGARITRALDGPHGARALLESLRRFLTTATAWCADRTSTSAGFLADRFTGAAARLDITARTLEHTSTRLRGTEHADHTDLPPATPAPAVAKDGEPDALASAFDQLAAELRNAPDGRTAADVLARVAAKDGPLDQLQRIVTAAAQQSTRLAPELTAELAEPLVAAVVHLGHVNDTLADLGDHLAAPDTVTTPATPAPATRTATASHDAAAETHAAVHRSNADHTAAAPGIVAQAARSTPGRRSTNPDIPSPTARRSAPADAPAAARPASAARGR